jgi:replicative DNA helicase
MMNNSKDAKPNNFQAEATLLGTLLINDKAMSKIEGLLAAEDFYSDRHKLIFEAAIALSRSNRPHDLVSVTDWLRDHGKLEKAGGVVYVTQLTDVIPFTGMLVHHAGIIREKAVSRAIAEKCASTYHRIMAGDHDACQQHENDIRRILSTGTVSSWVTLGDASIDAKERILEASKNPSGIIGLPSGIPVLDKMTSGLVPGSLVILAARPSIGKTALAMTMALASGGKVGFFSLETTAVSLATRVLASLSGIGLHDLRAGRVHGKSGEIDKACMESANKKIWIDETPGLSIEQIKSRARMLKDKHGLDILFVDYLQLASTEKSKNRYEEVSEVSRGLQILAKELGVCVIALSQLSRKVEERVDKRPNMSDLRESGQIEQDASVILFLYRDSVYNKNITDDIEKRRTEIIVAKQKDGPTGTVFATFYHERTIFGPW